MRGHRIRHAAQQHDRDVALAAFELRDIALGNAGDFREHLSRHPAQRAHGADTLPELFEKAGFGIGIFGHVPSSFWYPLFALCGGSGKRISPKRHRSRLPFGSGFPALTSALIRSAIKSASASLRVSVT